MKSRIKEAVERKRTCNCAQAVVCTYADLTGLNEEQCMALASPFGSGMGNMEGTCGALTGAAMVIGCLYPDRAESRKKVSALMNRFQARNQATQCRRLKGIDTGVVLRDCYDCVADACEFLEQEIEVK